MPCFQEEYNKKMNIFILNSLFNICLYFYSSVSHLINKLLNLMYYVFISYCTILYTRGGQTFVARDKVLKILRAASKVLVKKN